ncbi:MAG: hypothetical protein BWY59_01710 [Verrucomicrobia bacterium ADurb.Bin345]|nr:MAG: hypothetical protein BWY59_01710 [Verrucomicrobia bacterium ADurb.Bin345]
MPPLESHFGHRLGQLAEGHPQIRFFLFRPDFRTVQPAIETKTRGRLYSVQLRVLKRLLVRREYELILFAQLSIQVIHKREPPFALSECDLASPPGQNRQATRRHPRPFPEMQRDVVWDRLPADIGLDGDAGECLAPFAVARRERAALVVGQVQVPVQVEMEFRLVLIPREPDEAVLVEAHGDGSTRDLPLSEIRFLPENKLGTLERDADFKVEARVVVLQGKRLGA